MEETVSHITWRGIFVPAGLALVVNLVSKLPKIDLVFPGAVAWSSLADRSAQRRESCSGWLGARSQPGFSDYRGSEFASGSGPRTDRSAQCRKSFHAKREKVGGILGGGSWIRTNARFSEENRVPGTPPLCHSSSIYLYLLKERVFNY